jgi:hypothetical protein
MLTAALLIAAAVLGWNMAIFGGKTPEQAHAAGPAASVDVTQMMRDAQGLPQQPEHALY